MTRHPVRCISKSSLLLVWSLHNTLPGIETAWVVRATSLAAKHAHTVFPANVFAAVAQCLEWHKRGLARHGITSIYQFSLRSFSPKLTGLAGRETKKNQADRKCPHGLPPVFLVLPFRSPLTDPAEALVLFSF